MSFSVYFLAKVRPPRVWAKAVRAEESLVRRTVVLDAVGLCTWQRKLSALAV